MSTYREGDYDTREAAALLVPYEVVKLDSNDRVVKAAAGTDDIKGVVQYGGKSGDSVSYARINGVGSFKVRLGGTVAKGAKLTANASGRAVTATTGNIVFGTATAAGVSGDVIEYEKCDKVA